MRDESRTRLMVAGGLLAAHAAGHVGLAAAGLFHAAEPFGILLLASNVTLAAVLTKGRRDLVMGAAFMFLIASHALVGSRLAPDELTSGALLLVQMLVIYVGVQVNARLSAAHWWAFVASYLALFIVFIVFMENAEALFLLFLMGLAATARDLRLLAYFWALVLGFTAFQPYPWESTFAMFFVLSAVFGAKGAWGSRAAVVFLGAGMAVALFVLMPVATAVFGEELHGVERVLRDPRVTAAIRMTAITASVSTALLVAFCVPLAYALSRLTFPGKALLMSLIDLPIIIPQSAAGLALVKTFGGRQPIGGAIEDAFGIGFEGTVFGIVLAQVFVAMPFIVRAAKAAFDAVPERLEFAARTLGASPISAFSRVALPLASRGVFLGAVLAWARAAGEFGAVVFIAPTPETAPVAAYNRFHSAGLAETGPLVAALLLFSAAMFLLLQLATYALPAGAAEERQ